MTRFPSPLKQQRCRLDSAVVKVGCINHIISAFTFQWTQTRLPFRKTSNSLKSLLVNQEVLKLGGKKWQTYEFLFVFLNHQRAQMFFPTVIKCFPVDRTYIHGGLLTLVGPPSCVWSAQSLPWLPLTGSHTTTTRKKKKLKKRDVFSEAKQKFHIDINSKACPEIMRMAHLWLQLLSELPVI